MKTQTLAIAATSMLALTGWVLVAEPDANDSSPLTARTSTRPLPARVSKIPWIEAELAPPDSHSAGPVSAEEEAALAAWKERFHEISATHDTASEAALAMGREVGRFYQEHVAAGIAEIISRPPSERYDDLAAIRQEVNEGLALIFDRLGLEGPAWDEAAGPPLDRLDAEIRYAETAPDPERRMAMLHLDRTRLEKMSEAHALTDIGSREREIRKIDQWYDGGLGKIFAIGAPEFPAQEAVSRDRR